MNTTLKSTYQSSIHVECTAIEFSYTKKKPTKKKNKKTTTTKKQKKTSLRESLFVMLSIGNSLTFRRSSAVGLLPVSSCMYQWYVRAIGGHLG